MRAANNIRLNINSTIKDVLRTINNGNMQIAVITDDNDNLIGTVTDGDVRRGLLNGLGLDSPLKTPAPQISAMQKRPY